VLIVLMTTFIIFQIVRVANANANPLFAYAYVEDMSPKENFPQIAVCPIWNDTYVGSITNVKCVFLQKGQSNAPVSTAQSQYTIDGTTNNCWLLNKEQAFTATNLTDLIRCQVFANTNVLVSFYDSQTGPLTDWFAWNVLPYGQDSALGIVKWFFNGQVVGYQVQTIQQEYRFPTAPGTYDVLFTVQWDFLGQGNYGEIISYDFWTSVGVVGGYVFLAVQLYKLIMWAGFHLCKLQTDETLHTTSNREYMTI